jgi:Leucine-rich repeat (LRR) protein
MVIEFNKSKQLKLKRTIDKAWWMRSKMLCLDSNLLTDSLGYVSYNSLTSLLDSLCNLSALRKLDFSCNKNTILPENIGNLSRLAELYLLANKLLNLPESIGNLSELTY